MSLFRVRRRGPSIGLRRVALAALAACAVPAAVHAQHDRDVPEALPAERPGHLPAYPALDGLRLPTGRALGALDFVESRSPWALMRVPAEATGARSAAYPVDAGYVRVVPSVVVAPQPETDAPGLVALGVERSAAGDPLRWKAELGWSGASSGAFEVDYRDADRTIVLKGEDRPAVASLLPGGRVRGTLVETRWAERFDARTSATAALANDRLAIDGRDPGAASARVELRHRAADTWTLLARVDGATYSDAGAAAYRRGWVTVGTAFDASGIGVTALLRSEASPAAAGIGHGGRLTVRGAVGAVRASAYADIQQHAETIALEVHDPASLARDLGEAGLVGMRPETAVLALRDRPALLHQVGIAAGALRVDPLRVHGGVDVAWRPATGGAEFGVRVAYDGLDGAVARRAVLGGLYTSWRVFGGADLTASYANWTLSDAVESTDRQGLFRMSLRAPL